MRAKAYLCGWKIKNIKLNQYVKRKEQWVKILKPSNLNIKKRVADEGDFTCHKGKRSVKS